MNRSRGVILFLLALGLSLVHGPHVQVLRDAGSPRDTTTTIVGTIDLSARNHLYVRGHELTGTVTTTYHAGTVSLNGVTWFENFTPQRAAGRFKELQTYMTWSGPSLAIYTSYGTMLSCNADAERGLAEIQNLEAAGWRLDTVKTRLLSEGFLMEIAQVHGYRPRPPRVETTLITFPPVEHGLLRPKWQLLTPWHHLNTPAVVDSVVYIRARPDNLSVLDVRTGQEIRTVVLPETGMLENSVRDEQFLYVTPGNSNMMAVNLNTERPVWSRFMESQKPDGCGGIIQWMVTRPALGDGRVYFGSQKGKIYALERTSGRKLWTHDMNGAVGAAPTFNNGVVYACGSGRELVALSARKGTVLWTRYLGETIERGSPLVAGSNIYVAGRYGTIFAVDAKLGVIRWTTMAGTAFRGDVTASDHFIHTAGASGIYGLDPEDGRIVWTIPEAANNPVFAAGLIYCVTDAGELLVIEPGTGAVLERHDVSGVCYWSRPLVQDGRVFVSAGSDTAGSLMCFEMTDAIPGPD